MKNEKETAPIFKQEIFEETLKLLRQQQDHIAELETAVQALKAEKEKLKAVAAAELDTIHALGEDYEQALEEIARFANRINDKPEVGLFINGEAVALHRMRFFKIKSIGKRSKKDGKLNE